MEAKFDTERETARWSWQVQVYRTGCYQAAQAMEQPLSDGTVKDGGMCGREAVFVRRLSLPNPAFEGSSRRDTSLVIGSYGYELGQSTKPEGSITTSGRTMPDVKGSGCAFSNLGRLHQRLGGGWACPLWTHSRHRSSEELSLLGSSMSDALNSVVNNGVADIG